MELLRWGPLPDPQQKLIEQSCSEARKLLDRARSKEEAIEVKKRICLQLAEECDSLLVLDATQTYVDGIIRDKLYPKS